MLLHADGKKHRAKARAFHTSQQQSIRTADATPNQEIVGTGQKMEANGSTNNAQESDGQKSSDALVSKDEEKSKKKRKIEVSEDGFSKKVEEKSTCDLTTGEVIQADQAGASQHKSKKKKGVDESLNCKDSAEKQGPAVEASQDKIKWKKIITSTLKSVCIHYTTVFSSCIVCICIL